MEPVHDVSVSLILFLSHKTSLIYCFAIIGFGPLFVSYIFDTTGTKLPKQEIFKRSFYL